MKSEWNSASARFFRGSEKKESTGVSPWSFNILRADMAIIYASPVEKLWLALSEVEGFSTGLAVGIAITARTVLG
jgi:hypothetical protein